MSLVTAEELAQLNELFDKYPDLLTHSTLGSVYVGLIAFVTTLALALLTFGVVRLMSQEGKLDRFMHIPMIIFGAMAVGAFVTCFGNGDLFPRKETDFHDFSVTAIDEKNGLTDTASRDAWAAIEARYETHDITELGRFMIILIFSAVVTLFAALSAFNIRDITGKKLSPLALAGSFGAAALSSGIAVAGIMELWDPRRQFDERNGLVDGR